MKSNNNSMVGYNLVKFLEAEPKNRVVSLKAELNFGLGMKIEMFTIKLDDEDILHLLNKYKISKIEEKEIELSQTVKKLSQIEKDLSTLKSASVNTK